MKFNRINEFGIYIEQVNGIEAVPPDVGYYLPPDVLISHLGKPPTNEPNKWRDNGIK